MKKSTDQTTIRDVAQLAGVSPATVSKVLNDAPHVGTESRARVEAAIAKLNFRPNTIARSLRKSRTLTLGLLTDDIEGVFTMSLMRGVEEAAQTQGFSVFLCNSYGDMARERSLLDALLAKQVEGVVLLSGYKVRARGAPALPLGSLPVVYLYQYTHDTAVPSVIPDDVEGGLLGTRHLIESGYRRVALINGPAHYEATHLRLQGYRQALEEAGLPFDPSLVRVGKWHQDTGYRLTHELMALSQPPDAIFCTSDNFGAGALDALHELNIRVPDQVGLVGFDNRPFSAYQRPPLTTVALPLYEMGLLAGELLLAAILEGHQEAVIHKVPCQLIKRATTL